jgi:hypothetical protein
MSDPRRLLDSALDEAERAALLAALHEEPPAASQERIWSDLALRVGVPLAGVGGLVGGASTGTAAGAAAQVGSAGALPASGAGAPLAAAATGGASAATGGAILKGVATAFAVGLVVVGVGVETVRGPATTSGGAPSAVIPSVSSASAAGTKPSPPPQSRPASDRIDAEEATPSSGAGSAPDASARGMDRAEGPGIPTRLEEDPALESRLVSLARSRLRAGDARGALAALRDADARVGPGTLAQEREVLAIESLAASGQRAPAAGRAAAFLAAHPQSPFAPRLRALTEDP